jgi:SnoaL-like domain
MRLLVQTAFVHFLLRTPMLKHLAWSLFGIFFLMICPSSKSVSQTNTSFGVDKEVRRMADAIVRDLHNDGPIAWLKYFSRSEHFFMASNGQLAFTNNDSADAFVHRFAKTIKQIDLTWNDVRIDSLAPHLAVFAASFHEILVNVTGKQETSNGYFTGVAEYVGGDWKLRDAHWSIDNSKP